MICLRSPSVMTDFVCPPKKNRAIAGFQKMAHRPFMGDPGTKVIHIPNDACGLIIGKGGSMIQQLEAQSGTKIKMQKESTKGSATRELTLEGPPHAIAAAQVLITDKINEKQRLTGTWKGCASPPPAHAPQRVEDSCPRPPPLSRFV